MPMRIGTPLPALDGATEWINGDGEIASSAIQNRVALIHFWSVSCGICKENLPRLQEWRNKYGDDLTLVAVHMPRYPADQDLTAVQEVINKYEIVEPCAVDNLHKLRDAFQNEQGYVPAYYLFDREQKLRSFAAGERGLSMVAAALNRLLPQSSEN
jgi:thiol-disulfide isomerase/thioredoxin